MRISDWSSGVCSSDLAALAADLRWRQLAALPHAVDRARLLRHAGDHAADPLRHDGRAAVRPCPHRPRLRPGAVAGGDPARAAPRHRSEEHTSELQSQMRISDAVLCLKQIKYIHTLTEQV